MANVTKEQSHRTLKQWAERERELVEALQKIHAESSKPLDMCNVDSIFIYASEPLAKIDASRT